MASSVEDDDGLTRPGAKRVRLWRDRPPEGAFPRSSNAKAAKALCAARLFPKLQNPRWPTKSFIYGNGKLRPPFTLGQNTQKSLIAFKSSLKKLKYCQKWIKADQKMDQK